MVAAREDKEEGWWSPDTDTSDWRVSNAAIWVGSESRFASMAEGVGGVWGSGCSIGDVSEGERSRLSHNWRSAWRLW